MLRLPSTTSNDFLPLVPSSTNCPSPSCITLESTRRQPSPPLRSSFLPTRKDQKTKRPSCYTQKTTKVSPKKVTTSIKCKKSSMMRFRTLPTQIRPKLEFSSNEQSADVTTGFRSPSSFATRNTNLSETHLTPGPLLSQQSERSTGITQSELSSYGRRLMESKRPPAKQTTPNSTAPTTNFQSKKSAFLAANQTSTDALKASMEKRQSRSLNDMSPLSQSYMTTSTETKKSDSEERGNLYRALSQGETGGQNSGTTPERSLPTAARHVVVESQTSSFEYQNSPSPSNCRLTNMMIEFKTWDINGDGDAHCPDCNLFLGWAPLYKWCTPIGCMQPGVKHHYVHVERNTPAGSLFHDTICSSYSTCFFYATPLLLDESLKPVIDYIETDDFKINL